MASGPTLPQRSKWFSADIESTPNRACAFNFGALETSLEASTGRLTCGLGPLTSLWLLTLERNASSIIQAFFFACSGEFGPCLMSALRYSMSALDRCDVMHVSEVTPHFKNVIMLEKFSQKNNQKSSNIYQTYPKSPQIRLNNLLKLSKSLPKNQKLILASKI